MPFIVSIQVGRPQLRREADGLVWSSAIFKQPVQGPIWLRKTNLEGDRQADLQAHGGPEKAVLAYSADHYAAWQRELNVAAIEYGAFGENFSVTGQTEADVCVGDVYEVGEARVEVSQPRVPCAKLGRKWKLPQMPARVVETGRSGWYVRVLQEGRVEARQTLGLMARPFPQWTIQRASQVAYDLEGQREAAAELAGCPALAAPWREWLVRRLKGLR